VKTKRLAEHLAEVLLGVNGVGLDGLGTLDPVGGANLTVLVEGVSRLLRHGIKGRWEEIPSR